MIQESGQVIARQSDTVRVGCDSRLSCERCEAGRGCGGALIGRLLGDRQFQVRAHCHDPLIRVGDTVSLELEESVILRCAIVAYVVPLAGLLTGAVAGQALAGELAALGGSLLGLLAGGLAAKVLARSRSGDLSPTARLQ